MVCPKCKAPNRLLDIMEIRSHFESFNQRYHACKNCGACFQSYQKIDPKTITDVSPEMKDFFPNKKYSITDLHTNFYKNQQKKKVNSKQKIK